jgi:hypothetical protein
MKEDVERFSSLDTCVTQHAVLDPVVGDAVRSIGYDTLLRDACRVLQALKLKDTSPCAAITASALQNHCESLVAMALQQPDKCPWYSTAEKELGREPTCLAVAAHDPRACAASREDSTATCEALASGDGSRCAKAVGDEVATCARDFARQRTLLAGEHDVRDTAQPKAHLEIHGAKGTPDPATTDFDVSASVRGGAVLSTASLSGVRVELARDIETTLKLPSRGDRPHLSAALKLAGDGATAMHVDVSVPKTPELSCEQPRCDFVVTVAKPDPRRGAPLSATLQGTLEVPGAAYTVKLQIDTFVRDVVARAAVYGGR